MKAYAFAAAARLMLALGEAPSHRDALSVDGDPALSVFDSFNGGDGERELAEEILLDSQPVVRFINRYIHQSLKSERKGIFSSSRRNSFPSRYERGPSATLKDTLYDASA